MTDTKTALESLSMDLYRVAMGYHRGSIPMAKRFSQEALNRKEEINISEVKPYLVKILNELPLLFKNSDNSKIAEDALMYSTICKNYAKKFYRKI